MTLIRLLVAAFRTNSCCIVIIVAIFIISIVKINNGWKKHNKIRGIAVADNVSKKSKLLFKESPQYHQERVEYQSWNFHKFEPSPSLHKLLKIVDETDYRNRASLFINADFIKLFESLDKVEEAKILISMFNATWNTPVVTPAQKPKVRRFPDVIGIGAKKCGTGAFQFFMNKHPGFVSMEREIHFFDTSYGLGTLRYLKRLPRANADQLVFEKTPRYLVEHDVPRRIASTLAFNRPKLILLVCEPTNRAYSDYVHAVRVNEFRDRLYGDFTSFVRDGLHSIDNALHVRANRFDAAQDFEFHIKHIYHTVTPELSILTNGLYGLHLEDWLRHFNREEILILEGDQMLKDPLPLLKKAESFLGLPKHFSRNHIRRSTPGFFCYYGSVASNFEETVEEEYCMEQRDKGHTRSAADGSSLIPEKARLYLKKFYKPHNEEFFKHYGVSYDWNR